MRDLAILIGLLGILMVAAVLLRAVVEGAGLPALVAYLGLGLVLGGGESMWTLLPDEGFVVLETLGRMGIVALLFRVGLESDVGKLRGQLGRAGPIWAGSVVVSGAVGYATARWALDLAFVPSLFTAVALTATSAGVSLGVWQEAGALDSDTGALLVDTVELDDFSGVVLLALLVHLAPVLGQGPDGAWTGPLLQTSAVVLGKAALFLGGCFLFARYAEGPLSRGLRRITGESRQILVIVGVGLILAALAEILGFSFAIGAFFAGLIFSRDPDSVKLDTAFEELHAFLVPFFFIWLGFSLEPDAAAPALLTGGVLLLAAVSGKILGTGLPALPTAGTAGAVALGVSVVPRAEVAMVVMERGAGLGPWAVPPHLFGGAILVTLVTSALFPILTRRYLARHPDLVRAT